MINFLLPNPPKIGAGKTWVVMDAVLSVNTSARVTYTEYPLEVGANVSDHAIVQPKKFNLRGGVGSKPLRPQLTSIASGFFSNLLDDGKFVYAAGLSAGYLASSDDERPATALEMLYRLMYRRIMFSIDDGLVIYRGVVITHINVERNPQNETGLIFDAELQELMFINRATGSNPVPRPSRDKDPSTTQIIDKVNAGNKTAGIASQAAATAVRGLF